jgi:hypothetical protein
MHKLDPQTAAHVDKVLDDLQWDKWYATIPHDLRRKLAIHDFKRLGDVFKAAFAPSAARVRELEDALRGVEPFLDAIVCYASTMGEHEPNRIAATVRVALREGGNG